MVRANVKKLHLHNPKNSNRNGNNGYCKYGAISVARIITVEENVAWDYDKKRR
ncbi:hypothetical protein [Bacillus thuringiensis]|uniref:hypothetical protein n=1 Tax=Bacillus thuringiensis TaxID=1428 RepID=UPI001C4F8E43|nr:hypothetical protein [Bacillus thuringiensis]